MDMGTLLCDFSLWLQRMTLAQRRVMSGGTPMVAALSALLFCIVRHAGRLLRPPHGALQTAYDELEARVEARMTALRRVNATLQEELVECQRMAAALQAATAAAEAVNQAQSAWLANVSHALRTPLHGILSFANFGITKAATAPPEKLLGYFQQIHHSGDLLLTLLNRLGDLAKLEAGRMPFDFQSVDPGQLIAQVTDEFSALVSARQLMLHNVTPDLHVPVMLDHTTIMLVLRNLLSNAVQFSPQGGTITIGMRQDEHAVVVFVSDQGVGIPEAACDTIFEKFSQSSTAKTGAGSTGLGLATCRAVVRAHHGHLWAANRPEGGAVFSFALPLPCQDEAAADLAGADAVEMAQT